MTVMTIYQFLENIIFVQSDLLMSEKICTDSDFCLRLSSQKKLNLTCSDNFKWFDTLKSF